MGCATVAVAQYLYYYKKYNDKITPSGTSIDWDNMLDYYHNVSSPNYNSTHLNAVSNFMYYCAKAINVNFYNGSSATISSHIPALKNHFGYNPSMTYVLREYYSVEDWENIKYNE